MLKTASNFNLQKKKKKNPHPLQQFCTVEVLLQCHEQQLLRMWKSLLFTSNIVTKSAIKHGQHYILETSNTNLKGIILERKESIKCTFPTSSWAALHFQLEILETRTTTCNKKGLLNFKNTKLLKASPLFRAFRASSSYSLFLFKLWDSLGIPML